MRDLGIDANAHDFIAMKVQDITPEYVRQMRAAGFNPSTHELIAMKVQDVTPEYRKALEAAGYKLDVSELITAKVMDITPEFIAQGPHAWLQGPEHRQTHPAEERGRFLARAISKEPIVNSSKTIVCCSRVVRAEPRPRPAARWPPRISKATGPSCRPRRPARFASA